MEVVQATSIMLQSGYFRIPAGAGMVFSYDSGGDVAVVPASYMSPSVLRNMISSGATARKNAA